MNQDSWCAVEKSASQDWERAERKHHKNAFNSKVLKTDSKAKGVDRITNWTADSPSHKERHHFPKQHETQFKI